METGKIEVGDFITFKSPTRYGNCKVKRKVNGNIGVITVCYNGWNSFIVRSDEIISIEKRSK